MPINGASSYRELKNICACSKRGIGDCDPLKAGWKTELENLDLITLEIFSKSSRLQSASAPIKET